MEVKVPPAFEMKVKPESWKREEEANIKPMVWVSELRRKFFETTALSIAAGQHILIDVVVDDEADLGRDYVDSTEGEKSKFYHKVKVASKTGDYHEDGSNGDRKRQQNFNRSYYDKQNNTRSRNNQRDSQAAGTNGKGNMNTFPKDEQRRTNVDKSPGRVVELALQQHFENLKISYIRLHDSTPIEDLYTRRSKRSGQLRNGPIYSDIIVIEDLHRATYEMMKFINDIISFRRAPRPGDIIPMPLEHRFSIVAICSHKESSKNSSMLLPLYIRDSFLLSMRLDVRSILGKQKGLKSGSPVPDNDAHNEDDMNISNQPSVTDVLSLNDSLLSDRDEEKVSTRDNKDQRDKLNYDNLDYYESLCKFFLLDIKEREQGGYSRAAQNRRKQRQRDGSNSYSATRDAENLEKAASKLYISNHMQLYLINIQIALRSHENVNIGPTGRKISIGTKQRRLRYRNNLNCLIDPFLEAVRLTALLNGSEYVLPWHVRYITPFVFSHRLNLRQPKFSDVDHDLYLESGNTCLQVLLSIPCILSHRQMFFPVQRLPVMQRSYSVGKTPFDTGSTSTSNSNTPTMYIKKSPASMNDDTRILGKTTAKNQIDRNVSTIAQASSGSVQASSRTNLKTKSSLPGSAANVDNVSDNEALLNKHLFRTPTATNASSGGAGNDTSLATSTSRFNESSDYDFTLDFENQDAFVKIEREGNE